MPNLSPRERLLRTFELLEEGDAYRARVEVVAYLERVPNSGLAKDLLLQIDTDPQLFYPASYREVTLQPGQSLSNVAKEYLGSAFDFYALARYNNIERPRRVVPGQVVRIPLTPEAIAVFGDDSSDGVLSASDTSGAVGLAADMSTEMTATTSDTAVAAGADAAEGMATEAASDGMEAMTEATGAAADTIATGAEAGEAMEALSSAASELSDEAGDELPGVSAEAAAMVDEALSAGGTEAELAEAADAAGDALDDADDAVADAVDQVAAAAPTEPSVDLDALHREAINAYRSQDLDRAIGLWNEILAVDPSYESARLYRSQAEALKERLKRLQ